MLYQYRSLRAARVAVFAHFACFGVVLATWAVHLPSVQQRTGVSTPLLATLLLILGVGALIGMQICGVLVDRYGGARIAVAALPVMAALVVAPLGDDDMGTCRGRGTRVRRRFRDFRGRDERRGRRRRARLRTADHGCVPRRVLRR